MGLLEGKVAIITGSGNGIGRSEALLFASEGAKVVVNDLGGTRDGGGSDDAAASKVVEEIKAAGGEAVPNFDSVATMEGAQNIFKTAIDAFGQVDILVNNAGILRDKSFHKMSEAMWDSVLAVHLKGTFCCTKAVVDHMRERGSGCIVNTTSLAGLLGNFGQANYGAAKAGIAGLTRVLNIELSGKGVRVNAVAPVALTRMTDDLPMFAGATPEMLGPDFIAPVALWLASDLAKDISGKIVGVQGPKVFEYKTLVTDGVMAPGDKPFEARALAEVSDKVFA